MADGVQDVLWLAGRELGASVLGREHLRRDPQPSGTPPVRTESAPSPASVEHAVRDGRFAFPGRHRKGDWRAVRPGDRDLLLRLLERDDPELNASLFRSSDWPALRMAVLAQRRFTPHRGEPRPTTAPWPFPDPWGPADPLPPAAAGGVGVPARETLPLPLASSLRSYVLNSNRRSDAQAALAAADPDLAIRALMRGVPGGMHGGRLARLRAAVTLCAAGRVGELRLVLDTAPLDLPGIPPEVVRDELLGIRPPDRLRRLLAAEHGPDAFIARLRAALRIPYARSVVKAVLEPPWEDVAAAHDREPLPWPAAVALVEHPRCPAPLLGRLVAIHPRATMRVARPGPETSARCAALGEDQLTKQVVLRGVATGALTADDLTARIGPARIALTALVDGEIGSVATCTVAAGTIRSMLAQAGDKDSGVWRTVFTMLPHYDGTVAELLDEAAKHPRRDIPAGPDRGPDAPPSLGRQAAWAYATLIGLLGPEHVGSALDFLDDRGLASLARTPGVPRQIADHVLAHGGPAARLSLAANPAIHVDALEALVLGSGDPAVASAAYRNPRCPHTLRRHIISADVFDDALRAELPDDAHAFWHRLASPDLAQLLRVADAYGDGRHPVRLRAAYRIADLHGTDALPGSWDNPEIVQARDSGDIKPLREAVRDLDARQLAAVRGGGTLRLFRTPDEMEAVTDPGLDWGSVTAVDRAGELRDYLLKYLLARHDCPVEWARDVLVDPPRPRTSPAMRGPVMARYRALAVEEMRAGPVSWDDPAAVLASGAADPAEFLAATRAAQTVTAAVGHLPLARAAARLLHDELGDRVDSWVVLVRLLQNDPQATLPELAAAARAAT
ncbi:hypothetical protein [Yinghuangia soli]|uniref:Uncharacterized protein n=1 Tax=Yinghuangia soli TaxID=2908204 RepID=A0AA41Q7H8_9ACTN|nr:hypothetical protein [Yinghuangia soli]MCF2532131.1 hypothetical protein [Yinghuangia soli]